MKKNAFRVIPMIMIIVSLACMLVACSSETDSSDNKSPVNPVFDEEAVDLGLSVRWGKCNIGASLPYDGGSYYAWAEVNVRNDSTGEYILENCPYYKRIHKDVWRLDDSDPYYWAFTKYTTSISYYGDSIGDRKNT